MVSLDGSSVPRAHVRKYAVGYEHMYRASGPAPTPAPAPVLRFVEGTRKDVLAEWLRLRDISPPNAPHVLVPTSNNFPVWDVLTTEGTGFQMTQAETHPIAGKFLDTAVELCTKAAKPKTKGKDTEKNKFERLRIVHVTPWYVSYTEPQLRKDGKDVPAVVKQYAISVSQEQMLQAFSDLAEHRGENVQKIRVQLARFV